MTTDNVHEWDATDADHIEHMAALLPAWFCPRMADDDWHFGLLLTTGQLLHIETIDAVHATDGGGLWMDVRLGEPDGVHSEWMPARGWPRPTHSPTRRRTCSVNVAQVVCAVELADT